MIKIIVSNTPFSHTFPFAWIKPDLLQPLLVVCLSAGVFHSTFLSAELLEDLQHLILCGGEAVHIDISVGRLVQMLCGQDYDDRATYLSKVCGFKLNVSSIKHRGRMIGVIPAQDARGVETPV